MSARQLITRAAPILCASHRPDTTVRRGRFLVLGLLGDLLGGLVGGLLGRRGGDRILQRRAERLAQDGQVDCGLRVLQGRHPRVPPGMWMHSTARLSPGLIIMGGIVVRITELDATVPRRPKGRETWSLSPHTAIVCVAASTGAVLEWAVPADQLPWALEQVHAAA